jgi:sulfonate transport system permease protein
MSPHVFGNHARMPHLGLQPDKNCTFYCREIECLCIATHAARAYLQPTLEFIRPLPASAVMPIAIALLGLSEGMVLSVIAFGAIWPMLLGTVHGFSQVEPRLREVSIALGLSRSEMIYKIALPSAVPDILTGMRLGLTISLILAVIGEMLTSRDGPRSIAK